MLLIPCPWCGPRDVTEFRYGSEAGVSVPDDTPALTDEAWGEFLFIRSNPKGPFTERWSHVHGCRRWFTIRRDTATDALLPDAVPVGQPADPAVDGDPGQPADPAVDGGPGQPADPPPDPGPGAGPNLAPAPDRR